MGYGSGGDATSAYAGDMLLALAVQGRLVLDEDEADEAIAGLERTLAVIDRRVRLLEQWRSAPVDPAHTSHAEQGEIDALFGELVAPGQLRRALQELPKYVEAFRRAKRRPGSTTS
jgi:hypothetical protein